MLQCEGCGDELDEKRGYLKITGVKDGREDIVFHVGSTECLASVVGQALIQQAHEDEKRRRIASAN